MIKARMPVLLDIETGQLNGRFDHLERSKAIAKKARCLSRHSHYQVRLLNEQRAEEKALRDHPHVIRRTYLQQALFNLLVHVTEQMRGNDDVLSTLEFPNGHLVADVWVVATHQAGVVLTKKGLLLDTRV